MLSRQRPGRALCPLLFAALLASPLWAANHQDEVAAPRIAGTVPFFYYSDLAAAADWYENKLGLRRVTDEGWVVIFEVAPTAFIGLVNASDGTLRPAREKGVLLSIETPDLVAWYNRLKAVEGINMKQGIKVGAKGMIEEFRLQDPGGYIVEFFRWTDRPCTHAGKPANAAMGAVGGRCPTDAGHVDR